MPLPAPVLDDRNFDQLLDQAKSRIPQSTPEWTNFGLESDPGITIIELFAFLTDTLLYRVNRYPEANRIKFLQLLGRPLRPASTAQGIVAIHNERGPLAPLLLEPGIVLAAGNTEFVSGDSVNVLPVEAQVYYKRKIPDTDPRYEDYSTQHEAIALAAEAAADAGADQASGAGTNVQLVFYETMQMTAPTPSNPGPAVDLNSDTFDKALYIALLAPPNVDRDAVRKLIANQTLSIGVVPALSGDVKPLPPMRFSARPETTSSLIFEIPANPGIDVAEPQYLSLSPLSNPDVLDAMGIVQLPLPSVERLATWQFADPLMEGTEDFPPRIEDDATRERLVTWIRIRLRPPPGANTGVPPAARLTWVGINSVSIYQAVTVTSELLGVATGEPDQVFALANRPVLPRTLSIVTVQESPATTTRWYQVEDLLTAGRTDPVYSLDAEAGQVRYGDGLRGARPPARARLFASYQYGGGRLGNVSIGAVKTSRDSRLQGGFRIENPVPTFGGDLGETVAEAERNIPLILRHRDRLVTTQDFADVAMQTPGVDINRIDVLPLFRPGPPPQENASGVVTLMVVSAFDPVNPMWPTPDRQFLRRVCDYLDSRRLITTEIYVRGPAYVPVYVSVGIQVQGGFFPDLVRQAVAERLNTYLSSRVGLGPDGGGWPLRKQLQKKDLEAAVTRVSGVEYVNSLQLGVGSPTDVSEANFTGLMLPRLDGLRVVEGEAEPLASVIGMVVQPATPGVRIVPVPVIRAKC
jgi:hypothetical protein